MVGLFGILYGRSTLHDVAMRNAVAITTLKSNMMASWLGDRQLEVESIARSETLTGFAGMLETSTSTTGNTHCGA